jgi:hypothetical protein
MHRIAIVLSFVGALTVLVGIGQSSLGTSAQEDSGTTREAMATHPVVGAWRWDNDPATPNTHISYAIFHDDGTYLEVTTGAGTAVGSWQPTGERSAKVTNVFQDMSEDPTIVEPGEGTMRQVVEADETGSTLRALYTAEVKTLDGTLEFAGGPYEAIGTRVEVEEMVPFDTPVAATPAA